MQSQPTMLRPKLIFTLAVAWTPPQVKHRFRSMNPVIVRRSSSSAPRLIASKRYVRPCNIDRYSPRILDRDQDGCGQCNWNELVVAMRAGSLTPTPQPLPSKQNRVHTAIP